MYVSCPYTDKYLTINYRTMSRKAKTDEKIIKFSINVEEKVLTDLKQRLENARLKTDLEEPSFNYGFRVRNN